MLPAITWNPFLIPFLSGYLLFSLNFDDDLFFNYDPDHSIASTTLVLTVAFLSLFMLIEIQYLLLRFPDNQNHLFLCVLLWNVHYLISSSFSSLTKHQVSNHSSSAHTLNYNCKTGECVRNWVFHLEFESGTCVWIRGGVISSRKKIGN